MQKISDNKTDIDKKKRLMKHLKKDLLNQQPFKQLLYNSVLISLVNGQKLVKNSLIDGGKLKKILQWCTANR